MRLLLAILLAVPSILSLSYLDSCTETSTFVNCTSLGLSNEVSISHLPHILNISSCQFYGCPSIFIVNSTVNFINCSFSGSRTLHVNGNVYSDFRNSSVFDIRSSSKVIFQDVEFDGFSFPYFNSPAPLQISASEVHFNNLIFSEVYASTALSSSSDSVVHVAGLQVFQSSLWPSVLTFIDSEINVKEVRSDRLSYFGSFFSISCCNASLQDISIDVGSSLLSLGRFSGCSDLRPNSLVMTNVSISEDGSNSDVKYSSDKVVSITGYYSSASISNFLFRISKISQMLPIIQIDYVTGTVLLLENWNVSDLYTENGGTILSMSNSEVSIKELDVQRLTSITNVLQIASSKLSIYSSKITECQVIGSVLDALHSTIEIRDSSFESNSNLNGALINVITTSLTMKKSSFKYITNVNNDYSNRNGYGGVVQANYFSNVLIDECVVEGSSSLFGGAIATAFDTALQISNSYFQDCHAVNNGGFLNAESRVSILIENSVIEGSSSLFGGAISTKNDIKLQINNSYFKNCHAIDNGGFLNAESRGSILIENSVFKDAGSLHGSGGFVYVRGLDYHIQIRNSSFDNGRVDNLWGSCIYISEYTKLKIESSSMSNCYGSGALVIHKSEAAIDRVSFQNCYQIYQYGGSLSIESSDVVIEDSLFINSSALFGGAIGIGGQSVIRTKNLEFISNTAQYGGAIYVSKYSTLGMGGVTNFTRNTASANGGAMITNGQVVINGTVIFVENSAANSGGAILAKGQGRTTFDQSFVTAVGNFARVRGGFICMLEWSSLSLNATESDSYNNHASKGSLIYWDSQRAHDIKENSKIMSNDQSETLYFESASAAFDLMNSQSQLLQGPVKMKGPPSYLTLENPALSSIYLELSERIPEIKLLVYDTFGNLFDDANTPIIVTAKSSNGNRMFGGSTKAVTGSTVTFNDLEFGEQMEPGVRKIQFDAFIGQLKRLPNDTSSLTVSLTFEKCNAGSEIFIHALARCLPIRPVKPYLRIIFAVLSIILVIFGAANAVFLWIFRDRKIIRLNSVVFLFLINFGAILGISATAFTMFPSSPMCQAMNWLEYMGFLIVLTAIAFKTYRIRALFITDSTSQSVPSSALSESNLIKWFTAILLSFSIYLSIWSALSPSTYTQIVGEESYIVNDRCDPTIYGIILSFLKIAVLLQIGYLAFSVRKAPTEFNESQFIGFSIFNWIFFDSILYLIRETTVTDTDIVFAFQCLQNLLPNVITILLMITVKIRASLLTEQETLNIRKKERRVVRNHGHDAKDMQSMMNMFLQNFNNNNK